jgi:hypothetical protein
MRTSALLRRALLLGVMILCQFAPPLAYSQTGPGDDAVVLPKGFTRLYFDANFFIPFSTRFNNNGDTEPLGADLTTPLNSQVFTALAPLNAFVGGLATFGNSNVTIERNLQQYLFQPAYGLTDRLSVGMNIPYVWVKNNVTATVDSSAASGANIGFTTIASPFGPPGSVAPLALVPGTRRATVQDINNILVSQFGLQPIQTWEGEGFGDIEVGARYQYYRAENFRAAFTGGFRFPTGRVDDPNNLVDVGWGTGAYGLLFQFNQDVMFQREGLGKRLGFPSPGDFFFNTTFRYDLNLPNKQLARVCSPHAVCNNQDIVHRDLGDVVAVDFSGKFGVLFNGLIFIPRYWYSYKFKDQFSGDKNLPYGDLAIDTSRSEQIYMLSLLYSTVPLVGEKKFWFPAALSVTYRDRFAGTNVVKSQYVGFTAMVFF